MSASEEIRCLSVSTLFPSGRRPQEGAFILERLRHLPRPFAVEVLRLRPWFPFISLLKPHLADDLPRSEVVGGIRVEDRRFAYLPGLLKTLDGASLGRCLRRTLLERGELPHLLDAHFAYPAGWGAVRAGRALGLPVVVTLRGTMPAYLLDRRRGPIVATLKGATRLIAVSSSLAEEARRHAGRDLEVRVIGNGVDTSRFRLADRGVARERLGLSGRGPVLLTVGGLVPRKGAQRVVEVLPELRRRHPDLVYLVVGGGGAEGDFEGSLRRRVRELGLEDCVRFEGARAPADLPDYYGAADLLVLATSNEGWANVLQESLACGTPVVTTDVGGNREVVGGEGRGLVVPLGDRDALCEALHQGIGARWDRPEIARWGGRRDWSRVGEEVAAVFREALDVHAAQA